MTDEAQDQELYGDEELVTVDDVDREDDDDDYVVLPELDDETAARIEAMTAHERRNKYQEAMQYTNERLAQIERAIGEANSLPEGSPRLQDLNDQIETLTREIQAYITPEILAITDGGLQGVKDQVDSFLADIAPSA